MRKYVFNGSYYFSFGDALKALARLNGLEKPQEVTTLEDLPSVWANKNWLERHGRLAESLSNFTGSLEATFLSRPTYLPLLASGIKNAHIIDYGGGSGWVFNVLNQTDCDIKSYKIIDLESVITAYTDFHKNKLSYMTIQNITSIFESIDILYSNSTLQYNPDNSNILKIVKLTSPTYILLDEFYVSNQPHDWFTIQQNSDLPIICRFISPDRLVIDLNLLGYKLIWSTNYCGENYNFPKMNNYPKKLRIKYPLTLLFKKRN